DIPADAPSLWRSAGMRSRPARDAWQARVHALAPELRAEFERRMRGELPESAASAVQAVKQKLAAAPQELATRKASEIALEALIPALPELIGGSADLTGSNNTRIAGMRPISGSDFSGRFIHYGVGEHAMVAAMTGTAMRGGGPAYSGRVLEVTERV